MKRRLLSMLLALTMVLTVLPLQVFAAGTTQPADTANPFADVRQGSWYYDAVQYVRVNQLFNGIDETTFLPEGPMTRGMFVTVLGRMAGVDPDKYAAPDRFIDVPEDAYYAPYVAWAFKYGITAGSGDDIFSPDDIIDRQQMATFFVRYFEAFDVDYETGVDVTTAPADLDSAFPWARDAILKLWRAGLLVGDEGNFDPSGSATRAQAATICRRTDEAVDTWYSEPGVPSDRVRIDPATGLPYGSDTEATEPSQPIGDGSSGSGSGSGSGGGSGSGSGGGSAGGGNSTRYYEVKFALGDGQNVNISLPEAATYPAGTVISSLPTPAKAGTIFLGWYYDAEMKNGAETTDTVDRNMTLYAKVAQGDEVAAIETPNYITKTEVAAGTYTFDVVGTSDVQSAVGFIDITGGNTDVPFTVNGRTVSATLEAGQTYKVELLDEAAQFKLSGDTEAQPASIRVLNILTAKPETKNAQLNSDVKQINLNDVNGLKEQVFDGLYQIDESGEGTENTASGTFTYSGAETLSVGDTVAVKSADADLSDITSAEGDVAYLKITSVSGNTYGYEMAEVEDVLFMPDILPIAANAEAAGGKHTVTVTDTVMAAAMKAAEANSLDVGDFIGFYIDTGSAGYTDEAISSFGKIIEVETRGYDYVLTYTDAEESDVNGALDVYYEKDQKIELSAEEEAQIKAEIAADVESSGYVEEAAVYLAAVMLESNNLESVPDMETVSILMETVDRRDLALGRAAAVKGGNKVEVEFDKKNIDIKLGVDSKLEHLQGKGFKVSINIPFTVTIDGKIEIKVTATFEEEVVLKQKISTKRHKIGFLKYDYSLNASFNIGNYTGIGFRADITTTDGDDGDESMTKKLDEIMERMENYHESGGISATDGTMDSLAKIYSEVMENAGDTWIDVVDVTLFDTEGSAFLHIFCYQVKGDFVVSANLCVSIGMSFDYITQKQYTFSVRVKARTTTNETVDIIEPQYNFDFYVVGTIGVRAGLRLEMYVGLLSLKLDKIGITAEVGAYAQLWGYFFYHLKWTQSAGKDSSYAGAMFIEIGIYLDIKFVAQAFSSQKLTYNPTIYANEWPLWSAGEQKNVYGFDATDDTAYEFKTTKTLTLPGSTYTMKYMDLKSGKTGTVSKDDKTESSFIITFTNPAFTYAPGKNTVIVTPASGSVVEETDMVITWKKAALSFTSKPIQKTIHLTWGDPKNLRYISFDSQGGSAVAQISAGSGGAITWPAAPVKTGYTFDGWYADEACTNAYSGSTTVMPTFPEGEKGITLYANWTPAQVGYTVEYYLQQLNGTYKLYSTQNFSGITGTMTTAAADSRDGYTARTVEQQTITADGTTVVKVYYDRNTYTVTFKMGYEGAEDIVKTYRHGDPLAMPNPGREGYSFGGWKANSDDAVTALPATVTANATYTATWTSQGSSHTVLFDSRGGSEVASQTVSTGEKVTRPASDPVKKGAFFGGWYADSSFVIRWDFDTDTVTGFTTLYAKWIEDPVELLTGVTFCYAYDAQRKPATPTKGQEIKLTGLDYPLISYRQKGTTNVGQWKLSKAGTYGSIKDTINTSTSNLSSAVNTIATGYSLTADDIMVYELKNGEAHIAYGVIAAFDLESGYALFLGDTWDNGAAGYLLSKTQKSGSFTAVAGADATDFSLAKMD